MARETIDVNTRVENAESSAAKLLEFEDGILGSLISAEGLSNSLITLQSVLTSFDSGSASSNLQPFENQLRKIDSILKTVYERFASLPNQEKKDSYSTILDIAKENKTLEWDKKHNGKRGKSYQNFISSFNQSEIEAASIQAINKGLVSDSSSQLAKLFSSYSFKKDFDKNKFIQNINSGNNINSNKAVFKELIEFVNYVGKINTADVTSLKAASQLFSEMIINAGKLGTVLRPIYDTLKPRENNIYRSSEQGAVETAATIQNDIANHDSRTIKRDITSKNGQKEYRPPYIDLNEISVFSQQDADESYENAKEVLSAIDEFERAQQNSLENAKQNFESITSEIRKDSNIETHLDSIKQAEQQIEIAKDTFYENVATDFSKVEEEIKKQTNSKTFDELKKTLGNLSLPDMIQEVTAEVDELRKKTKKQFEQIEFKKPTEYLSEARKIVDKFKEQESEIFNFDAIYKKIGDRWKPDKSILDMQEKYKALIDQLGGMLQTYSKDGKFDITNLDSAEKFGRFIEKIVNSIEQLNAIKTGLPEAIGISKVTHAREKNLRLDALESQGLLEKFFASSAQAKIWNTENKEYIESSKYLEEITKVLKALTSEQRRRDNVASEARKAKDKEDRKISTLNGRYSGTSYLSFKDALVDSLRHANSQVKYRRGLGGIAMRILDRSTRKRAFGDIGAQTDSSGNIISGSGFNAYTLAAGGAVVATSKLIDSIIKLSKASLAAFGEIESIRVNLGVVYGNQSEANSMFDKIAQYAVKSPFGVQQVSEFAVLLKQSGVYSSDLLRTLKMIGDVSGGNAEKMKRIANNYAQIIAMGKANSLDLRQFANAGIPIYEILREQLGISQKALRQKASAGEITSDVIEKAFTSMTSEGGRFYKAVDKGSKTYKARVQNFEDMKQLALSDVGEWLFNIGGTGYERSIAQGLMNFGETFLNNYIREPFSKYNQNRKINGYNNNVEDFKSIINDYKALNSNTDSLEKNSAILNSLSTKIDELYPWLMEEGRTLGSKAYLQEELKLSSEIRKAEILNEAITNLGGLEEVQKYAEQRRFDLLNENTDPRNSYVDLIEKQTGINLSYIYDNAEYKRLDKALHPKEVDNLRKSDNYRWYLQTMAIESSRKTAESFGTYSKEKYSSSSLDASISEQFKTTDNYKLKELEKKQNSINEAKYLLERQKSYKVADEGFSWLSPMYQKSPVFLDKKDVADLLKLFYGNSQLDLRAENINKNTLNTLFDNAVQLKTASQFFLSDDQFRMLSDYTNDLYLFREDYNNASNIFDKQAIQQNVAIRVGKLKEIIDETEDESIKTILQALVLDPKAIKIDEEQLNAVIKENAKKYSKFWKRYSASTLGISVEGIDKLMERGIPREDAVMNQFKDVNVRTLSQNIFNAALGAGGDFSTLLSNVKTKNGSINQFETAENFKKIAKSTELTSDSIAATQAYLSSLTSTVDSLNTYLSGAMIKQEDLDKLWDTEWASQLGYKGKEDIITAFGSDAFSIAADGAVKLNDAILQSINSFRESAVAQKDIITQFNNLKTSAKQLDEELRQAAVSEYAVQLGYSGKYDNNNNYKSLSSEGKARFVNEVAKSLEKNGTTVTPGVLEAFLDKFFNGKLKEEETEKSKNNKTEYLQKAEEAKKFKSKYQEIINTRDSEYQQAKKSNVKNYSNAQSWYLGEGLYHKDGWKQDNEIKKLFDEYNKTIKTYEEAVQNRNKYRDEASSNEQLAKNSEENLEFLSDITEQILAHVLNIDKNSTYNRSGFQNFNSDNKKDFSKNSQNLNEIFIDSPFKDFFPKKYEGEKNATAWASEYFGLSGAPLKDIINRNMEYDAGGNLRKLVSQETEFNRFRNGYLNDKDAQHSFDYKKLKDTVTWGSVTKLQKNADLTDFSNKISENGGIEGVGTNTEDIKNYLKDNLNGDNFEDFAEKACFAKEEIQELKENLLELDYTKVTEGMTALGKSGYAAKTLQETMKGVGKEMVNAFSNAAVTGFSNTFKTIGKTLMDTSKSASDGAEEIGQHWKDAAQQMFEAIGPAATIAGLQLLPTNWVAGLALIAAGGVMSVLSGMLGASNDNEKEKDDDDTLARIQNVKDALSELIDQAKTDAEYYQAHVLHRNALSRNNGFNSNQVTKVNDAIITPSGNVISTAPDDYLIATKTPDTLVNNNSRSSETVNVSPVVNIGVYNQSGTKVESADIQQTQDKDGNIDIKMIIKEIGAEAIANGDWDDAFAMKQANDAGKSYAW